MSSIRKSALSSKSSSDCGRPLGGNSVDIDQIYTAMQKGHSVVSLSLLKKKDKEQKLLSLNLETRQILLSSKGKNSAVTLDLRHVKEAHTLDYKLHGVGVTDKWDLKQVNPVHVLLIAHGDSFNISYWTLYFNDRGDVAALWAMGIKAIVAETLADPHPMVVNRWMKKQFNALAASNNMISMKHMKPFTQTTLQSNVQSSFFQELIKPRINFVDFDLATRALIINNCPIFTQFFGLLSDDKKQVTFTSFKRFLKDMQKEDFETEDFDYRARKLIRRFLDDPSMPNPNLIEPTLTIDQFIEWLLSRENSVFDPKHEKILHDMKRPLSHYWIASSHNTYLTGDQLRSDSSLDSYAQVLLMGCRCIELDCWNGTRKRNSQDVLDIVIYHGRTITSKLQLRDVLFTIKHYAFINSEFPVILSIEDHCTVPAQRILASDIKEILGDLLVTQPVSREETELPSPYSMKRKFILKHKKLAVESDPGFPDDDFADADLPDNEFCRLCIKRGILQMRNAATNEWTSHIFVLFADRLCFSTKSYNEKTQDDSVSGDNDHSLEEQLSGFGVRPEEMHVTEEWFHGTCDRTAAVARLNEQRDRGNGVFLVRYSTHLSGFYVLSFLHEEKVYHSRINTKMVGGQKKYLLGSVETDTLFELVLHYMKVILPDQTPLTAPNFSICMQQPCPQPTPHLDQPWFSATATKDTAEEMLSKMPQDGAFLVRHSSTAAVFVISVRLDGEFWHYRLKQNGRIFIVNQIAFETLNQIVEYYRNRDFARGASLKFPVNETTMAANALSAEVAAPGCYMDLATFDENIRARSLRPYEGDADDQLSFPANAIITVLKKEGIVWRGKYDGKVGWFPSGNVQELPYKDKEGEQNSYETIELAGVLVERVPLSESHDRPNVLRITYAAQHWTGRQCMVSASTADDADDWANTLTEVLKAANEKISHLRTEEKTAKIASELSNLVVYCKPVPFNPSRVKDRSFDEMCSLSESKFEKVLEKGLVQFNSRHLSRVYPSGLRVNSANYSPIPMWNAGCHMVNNGKFLANGRCGYVLKPAYMLDESFDPLQMSTSAPVLMTVRVIAGRHLSRKDKNKGICSPFVEIEILGLPCDEKSVKTNSIPSNGLNPFWNESFTFPIHCPEIALLRFVAEDGDFVGPGTDPFIGQAVFPVNCIRPGYRSIPLKNTYSEELELSSLLVHVEFLGVLIR